MAPSLIDSLIDDYFRKVKARGLYEQRAFAFCHSILGVARNSKANTKISSTPACEAASGNVAFTRSFGHYQIVIRFAGSTYILSPGLTSKAL